MKERERERSLWLTEEEAMGLLDVALLCPGDLTPAQRSAVIKLSDFCRQFLRSEDARPARVSPPVGTLRALQCES